MSEFHPGRPRTRVYRSERRREQQPEAPQAAEAPASAPVDPSPPRQAARQRQTQPPAPPNPRPKGPRRRRHGWLAPLLAVVIPLALIALGITGFFWVHERSQPQPDPELLAAENHERLNYPLYYRDLIQQNAAQYDLPPSLIAAVVLCESSFKPDAVSRVSARGLMQLMPNTAQWVGEKLGDVTSAEELDLDLMFVAENNLRYGSWYLNYLMNRFEGNMLNAVCAYHAGQGNVDSWLQNPDYSKDGVTLDRVPKEDTERYANRVLTAQEVYQRRYFSALEGPPQA